MTVEQLKTEIGESYFNAITMMIQQHETTIKKEARELANEYGFDVKAVQKVLRQCS